MSTFGVLVFVGWLLGCVFAWQFGRIFASRVGRQVNRIGLMAVLIMVALGALCLFATLDGSTFLQAAGCYAGVSVWLMVFGEQLSKRLQQATMVNYIKAWETKLSQDKATHQCGYAIAYDLWQLGNITRRNGDARKAVKYFEEARSFFGALHNHPSAVSFLLDWAEATSAAGYKEITDALRKQAQVATLKPVA